MLDNAKINRAATIKIAKALGNLNREVVFVGGAIVGFYVDDPSAQDVRPTADVDISMAIKSLSELEAIRNKLIHRGFYQTSDDTIICRFRYDGIKVDVMSTKPVGWAPANPWFEPGFNNPIEFDEDDTLIRCLSLPYFMASKLTAFYDRGSADPRTSHDFEDIVYLLNYTTKLAELIKASDEKVKHYLKSCFSDILKDPVKQEAILGNLFHEDQDIRYKKITDKLNEICGGN